MRCVERTTVEETSGTRPRPLGLYSVWTGSRSYFSVRPPLCPHLCPLLLLFRHTSLDPVSPRGPSPGIVSGSSPPTPTRDPLRLRTGRKTSTQVVPRVDTFRGFRPSLLSWTSHCQEISLATPTLLPDRVSLVSRL